VKESGKPLIISRGIGKDRRIHGDAEDSKGRFLKMEECSGVLRLQPIGKSQCSPDWPELLIEGLKKWRL